MEQADGKQLDGEMSCCGDWRLDCEIGHGAYGVVYAAVNSKGERAAVKVCRRETIGEERYERELRGARLYSAIPPQDGLVRMLELAEEQWGFYTVMELADDEFGQGVSGGRDYRPKTLASVIDGEKALPLDVSVKLGIALAKGLETLQRHHLLHRDIKPGNVIYVRGRPVLSDPGLVVEESQAVSLVGTPGYVPPENFTDAAGDIYSLGLTLKAASFGRKIEDLDKGPALEADTGSRFFPAWWRILNKATDPTPSRRYQSAKALLKDLKELRLRTEIVSKFGSRATRAIVYAAAITVVAFIGYLVVSNDRMSDEVSKISKEITPAKGVVNQAQLASYLADARNWIDNLTTEIFCLHRIVERLYSEIDIATDDIKLKQTNEFRVSWGIPAIDVRAGKDVLQQSKPRLLELKKQLRELAVRICKIRIRFNQRIEKIDGTVKNDVEELIAQARKLDRERTDVEKEIYGIARMAYGNEKWEPGSDWKGDFNLDNGFGITLNEVYIFYAARRELRGEEHDLQTLQ